MPLSNDRTEWASIACIIPLGVPREASQRLFGAWPWTLTSDKCQNKCKEHDSLDCASAGPDGAPGSHALTGCPRKTCLRH